MSVDDMVVTFMDWFNTKVADSDVPKITRDKVYVVWFNYTLGNSKALISTTYPDHMYYELTHDVLKERVYIDAYKKVRHDCDFLEKHFVYTDPLDPHDYYYTSNYKKENKHA